MAPDPATAAMGRTTGTITDLHRAALHDGPGIRTTVFLKGCPLACAWCHNPETWSPRPQVLYSAWKCTSCAGCASACAQACHTVAEGSHGFDRAACTGCQGCATACPGGALTASGRSVSAGGILATVARDRRYYAASGGGLTISGGEPQAQPAFTRALLTLAKQAGIHTCLDTSGHAPVRMVAELAPVTDLVLFDWKASAARHRELTGVDQGAIAAQLDAWLAAGVPVRLRCPLVPGINDDDEHLAGIAALSRRAGIVGVDLMPYHRLGGDKWARLGLAYPLAQVADAGPDAVAGWRARLQQMDAVAVGEG